MATAKKTTARKAPGAKKTAAKASENKASGAKTAGKDAPHSMPKAGKDPKGGLTAAGRAYFAEREGSHLRPGVKGAANTPEKMLRKGSFLRRHFTHPRGPMKDEKGEPTRLALSAHAWGEPVPNTMADAHKLADEGHELLEQYHEAKGDAEPAKHAAKKSPGKKSSSKKTAAKKTASKTTAKKVAAKKVTAKKAPAKRPHAKSTAK